MKFDFKVNLLGLKMENNRSQIKEALLANHASIDFGG
jgi:hypothetical protein